ncbi:Cytochrome b-c1 complex subunit 9 [Bienertia sinuspersici]
MEAAARNRRRAVGGALPGSYASQLYLCNAVDYGVHKLWEYNNQGRLSAKALISWDEVEGARWWWWWWWW